MPGPLRCSLLTALVVAASCTAACTHTPAPPAASSAAAQPPHQPEESGRPTCAKWSEDTNGPYDPAFVRALLAPGGQNLDGAAIGAVAAELDTYCAHHPSDDLSGAAFHIETCLYSPPVPADGTCLDIPPATTPREH